jgi:hypothetical protein
MQIGPAQGAWSGLFEIRQEVNYAIISTLKGIPPSPTITVRHLLVEDSRNADTTKVGLSPTVFAKDNKLIVFARFEAATLEDFSENYGTIRASDINITAVKNLISQNP